MNSEHALSPAGAFGVTPAWVQTTAVFALALSVFLVSLDQLLHFDEFYHILAERSWAADGEMRIAEGVYTRGWLYTTFLGWWFSLFDDDLVITRLPSALAIGQWVANPFSGPAGACSHAVETGKPGLMGPS
ncbi:hypothetical protein [Rhodospirillaceae bacterium SYSU D60014]|uniref:hypothetical protein n=1 Tax=Virgifigura deserti TaxID=2268457 RepID=UPI0013C3F381